MAVYYGYGNDEFIIDSKADELLDCKKLGFRYDHPKEGTGGWGVPREQGKVFYLRLSPLKPVEEENG